MERFHTDIRFRIQRQARNQRLPKFPAKAVGDVLAVKVGKKSAEDPIPNEHQLSRFFPFPKKKILLIDVSDLRKIQKFLYNSIIRNVKNVR